MHRFYQEQYQLNGGQQNRYVTGSDAVGLTMGTYDTKALPIYEYLHGDDAPNYVIADKFFQGAFGGSFLNHQWLIAGRAPVDTKNGTVTPVAANSVVDANGMPTSYTPLYTRRTGAGRGGRQPAHRGLRRRRTRPTTPRPAATSRSTPCSRPARRSAPAPRSRSSTTTSTPTSVTG